MTSRNEFLYRALRIEEINAGNLLLPKEQRIFQDWPQLGLDTTLPFILGPTEEYAAYHHQLGQKTSGVSTTPIFEIAKFYAHENKIIVKISRDLLQDFNIKEIVVSEKCPIVIKPEDQEVILIKLDDKPWPKEIIQEVIKIS